MNRGIIHKVFVAIFLLCWLFQIQAQGKRAMEYWYNAIDCFDSADYIRSIEYYEKFLELEPESSYGWFNYALALEKIADHDEFCEAGNKAFEYGYTKNIDYLNYYCDKEYLLKALQKSYYRDKKLKAENGYRPVYTEADSLRGALRPERTCFDVSFYDLTVRIFPLAKKIEGYNTVRFAVKENTNNIQLDLYDNMIVDSIVYNSTLLDYDRKYNAIFIHFPKSLQQGADEKIIVYYHGKPIESPNPPWEGGFVWGRDRFVFNWAGVACEGDGASLWWPTKDHLSDEPDSMRLNFEVPGNYTVVSNGTFIKKIKLEDRFTRHEWFVNYPINNYNVTFYLGKYTEFLDSVRYKDQYLKCSYYVLPYHIKKARKHFKLSLEVLEFYNKIYGPFPFWKDGYRLVEAPYEGMEHQTAIAYGNEFDNTRTEWSYDNKDYDYIIVHETAHEWWGNAITAGDLAEAWLHEAFATYSEFLFIEEKDGYQAYLKELIKHGKTIYNFWPMVQNYNVNENSFASSDIYQKGAMMLHTLRATINNDSLFFQILHDFNMQYRMQVIGSNDFIDFVNKSTGDNYYPFFNKYLYETRLPVLSYKYTYTDHSIVLSYKWNEVEKGFFMPFTIKTSTGEYIRLTATDEWQITTLHNTESFNFINQYTPVEEIPENGYTYFWTHKEKLSNKKE